MSSTFAVGGALGDELLDLGIAVGVVTPAAGAGPPTLNTDWFARPAHYLGRVLGDPEQRDALLRLAAGLVGAAREELDLPPGPDGEQWVPIAVAGPPHVGVYVVLQVDGDDVLLSLGGRLAAGDASSGLEAGATVAVPLLRVDGSGAGAPAAFALGTADGIVRVAATVRLAGGLAPGDASAVSLRGAAVNVAVPTDGTSQAVLGLVLSGLRLPGEAQARDVAISQLDDLGADALKIFAALLEAQATAMSPALGHLLALIGLHDVQGIPELPVDELVSSRGRALRTWFEGVLADPVAGRAWLGELAALLGAQAPVTGDGTPATPYRLVLAEAPEVALTVVLGRDAATGVTHVQPGLSVTFEAPDDAPVGGRARARAELVALALGPTATAAVLPALDLTAELGGGTEPLLDVELPATTGTTRVRVGSARVGLALDAQHRPLPVLEARDVALGGRTYAVIDLTSADAVAALEDAVEDQLAALLDSILAALGAGPEARALLVLAGWMPPALPEGVTWPVPRVDLHDLFADPLKAIAAYHLAALAATIEEEPAWRFVVADVGRLLTSLAEEELELAGDGTADDPWAATLFDNTDDEDDPVTGEVALVVWLSSAGGGRSRVHAGVRVGPRADALDAADLDVAFTSELLRVELPPAAAPDDPVVVAWAPSHAVEIALRDSPELRAGGVVLSASEVEGGLRWAHGRGVEGRLAIRDPALGVDGPAAPLPAVEVGWGEPLPAIPLDALPWRELERLAGNWLAAAGGDWGERLSALLGWLPAPDELRMRLAALPELTIIADSEDWPVLSLYGLLTEPGAALRGWLAELTGDPSGERVSLLAATVWAAGLASGAEPQDGVVVADVSGSGGPDDPLAIPLAAGPRAPSAIVWAEPSAPPLAGLEPHADHFLPPPDATLAQLAEALRRAAVVSLALRAALGEGRVAPPPPAPPVEEGGEEVAADAGESAVAAQLVALRDRLAAGDGLVAATDQAPGEGWTAVELGPVPHHAQPAAFDPATHLPGVAEDRVVYVSAPLAGAAPWPGQDPARTIDLTARGLAPEAFDLSAMTGPGPWYLLLPTRADAAVGGPAPLDGLAGLRGRLERALAAARDAGGGEPVAVVAHSTSGLVARLAAEGPGVSHVVTVGTPHGGASLRFLDDDATGSALRLVQRLVGMLGADDLADPALAPLTGVLASVGAALDDYVTDPQSGAVTHVPFPADDFTAPAFGALDAGVQDARALVATLDGDALDAALRALVLRVVVRHADPPDAAASFAARMPPTHVVAGVRLPLAGGDATTGHVAVDAELRLEGAAVALTPLARDRAPRARLRAAIRREGGWLVGGPGAGHPAGAPRDPRVRWAEVELAVAADPLDASVRIVLHDASLFGRAWSRWTFDGAEGGAITPELRVLLGEIARAMSPLPAGGSARAAAELLAALGVATITAEGGVELAPDAVDRLLVDPVGEIAARLEPGAPSRAPTLAALAGLAAGRVEGEAVVVPLGGGLEGVVDVSGAGSAAASAPLGLASIGVRSAPGGFDLAGVLSVHGALRLDVDGGVSGDVRVAAARGGEVGLAAAFDLGGEVPARVWLDAPAGPLGGPVALFPVLDEEGLAARAAALGVGELVRIALESLARSLGMEGARVRNPAPILADPAGWLASLDPLGRTAPSPMPALVDAIRGLLGWPGDPGTLPLPWGLRIAVADEAAGLRVALDALEPLPAGGATLAGSLGLRIDAAGVVTPALAASISIAGAPAGSGAPLDLDHAALAGAFDGTAATLTLTLAPRAGDPIVLRLLPSNGLADLAAMAGAAAERILPLVLDGLVRMDQPEPRTTLKAAVAAGAGAIQVASPAGFPAQGTFHARIDGELVRVTAGAGTGTWTVQRGALGTTAAAHAAGAPVSLAQLGAALAQLGDALALRQGGAFSGDQLAALAGDPVGELVARLRAGAAHALAAVETLAGAILPGRVTAAGRTLTVRPLETDDLTLTLDVPEAGSIVVCASVAGVEAVGGIEVRGTVCAADDGLRTLTLGAEVTDPELLEVAGLPLLPFASVLLGTDAAGEPRLEAGLWITPPDEPVRDALAVLVPFAGGGRVVCRRTGQADVTDVAECAARAVREWLVPLLANLVLGVPEVRERLDAVIAQDGATTASLGAILTAADVLDQENDGAYVLAPGALDLDELGDRVIAVGAHAARLLSEAGWPDGGGEGVLHPLRIRPRAEQHDGRVLFGVRLDLAPNQVIELFKAGGVKVDVTADASWLDDAPAAALDVLLLSAPADDFTPGELELRPWIRANGVGMRVSGDPGPKLIDLVASVDAVSVHGAYERDFGRPTDGGLVRAGGRVLLDRLTIPLGRAADNRNPIASKLLAPGGRGGDPAEPAPAVSPALVLIRQPPAPTRVQVRMADGEGPWWVPVQRKFGVIYIEQVGLDTQESGGTLDRVVVLLDGSASVAGLNVGLDDFSVSVPARAPYDVSRWRVDLAGLGVAYEGSGLSLAGGLRKRPGTPPDYVGFLAARFGAYGLGAVAGYGEYPTGTGGTYPAFFVFAAVNGPIGGPPAFFVTGLGGGIGLNRRLVVPSDITAVPSFPLVRAMDPAQGFTEDPVAALDSLASAFPPERGAFWLAAGVRFTSFTVVDSIAVLAVAIGRDLEVSLLGLSRATLPRPEAPIAHVELALRARFSAREATLLVQAQLTDNSWLISRNCRLTGGFAFGIWFRTGQFVLTLGGYHPAYRPKPEFPLVPRLGFNWAVSSRIAIKGEAYFALTATCVMAGGRLEASYRGGAIRASFIYGMDAIVSWDPLFYDFHAYVGISASVEMKVCVWPFGCARARVSVHVGASVHVWGPELRGEAEVDLGVASLKVSFGSSAPPTGREPIGWREFHDKYLVAGDPRGETMDAVLVTGAIPVEAAAGNGNGAGAADGPWRVAPEFAFATHTRAASNRVNGRGLETITTQAIGLGPMGKASVVSTHTVRLLDRHGGDHAGDPGITLDPVVDNVPEGVWRVLGSEPVPEANVRPAYVGANVTARSTVAGDRVLATTGLVEVGDELPLPFYQEAADRARFEADMQAAAAYVAAQPTETGAILARVAATVAGGPLATPPSPLAQLTAARDRAATPELAPLTLGMVELNPPPPAPVEPVVVPETEPPSSAIVPPRLLAVLRGSPPAEVRNPVKTTVPAGTTFPRVRPPVLTGLLVPAPDDPVPFRLDLLEPEPDKTDQTVVPSSAGPATGRAGGAIEARRGFRLNAEQAASLADLQAGAATGVPVTAGDFQLWELPNAEFDTPANPRPSFRVAGDPAGPAGAQAARVVVLDRGGRVLADRGGDALDVPIPVGGHRILVAGLGSPDAAGKRRASGLAGWHAGSPFAQLAANTYVGSGVVVTATSPDTTRAGQAASAAMVRAADAVAGRAVVATRFAAPVTTVVIALQTATGIDELLAGLVLGLEGARRADGVDVDPDPPSMIVSGARVYAVFAVTPDGAGPVTVTVASDERWELAGAFGAAAPKDEVVRRVRHEGLDRLLAPLVASPLGRSTATWRQEG